MDSLVVDATSQRRSEPLKRRRRFSRAASLHCNCSSWGRSALIILIALVATHHSGLAFADVTIQWAQSSDTFIGLWLRAYDTLQANSSFNTQINLPVTTLSASQSQTPRAATTQGTGASTSALQPQGSPPQSQAQPSSRAPSGSPSGSPQPPPPPPNRRRAVSAPTSVATIIMLPNTRVPFYNASIQREKDAVAAGLNAQNALRVSVVGAGASVVMPCAGLNASTPFSVGLFGSAFVFSNLTFEGCGKIKGHWWNVQQFASASFRDIVVKRSHAWIRSASCAVTMTSVTFDDVSSDSEVGLVAQLDGGATLDANFVTVRNFAGNCDLAGSGLFGLTATSTMTASSCVFNNGNFLRKIPTSQTGGSQPAAAAINSPGGETSTGTPDAPGVDSAPASVGGILLARDRSVALFTNCNVSAIVMETASAGVFSLLDSAAVQFNGGVVTNVTAVSAGFANVANMSSLTITRVAFSAVVANGTKGDGAMHGGLAVIEQDASLKITSGSIVSSSASNLGGLVYADCRNCVVDVSGLLVTDCSAGESGGVFYINGRGAALTVSSSKFDRCASRGAFGGVAAVFGARFRSVGVTISSSSASALGGCGGAFAIVLSDSVTVDNSSFVDLSAMNAGGALVLVNSTGIVRNCNFTRVTAGAVEGTLSRGGALWMQGGRVDIVGAVFDAVASIKDGGAVSVTSGARATIATSRFLLATSGLRGGALHVEDASLIVTSCNFTNVTAGYRTSVGQDTTVGGGLLYTAAGATVTMSGCNIGSASATDNGGAFLITTNAGVSANGCNFNRTWSNPGGNGGLAALTQSAALSLTNCVVLNSAAIAGLNSEGRPVSTSTNQIGGGVARAEYGSTFNAVGCTFGACAASGCTGGFVALFTESISSIRNCSIVSAEAGTGGGFASTGQNSQLRADNMTIGRCVGGVKVNGGFLLAGDGVYEFDSCRIGDSSADSGGLIMAKGGNSRVVLRNSVVDRCSAMSDGGLALSSENAVIVVSNSRVGESRADQGGVAFVNDISTVTLVDVIVGKTSASFGGFVGLSKLAAVVLRNVSVTRSTASTAGGVLVVNGFATVNANNITFGSCTSGFGSFVSAGDDAKLTLLNCDVGSAAATSSGGALSLSGRAAVLLTNATFGAVSAGVSGGLLSLQDDANVTLSAVSVKTSTAVQTGGLASLTARSRVVGSGIIVGSTQAGTLGGFASCIDTSACTFNYITVNTSHAGTDGGFAYVGGQASATIGDVRARLIGSGGEGGFLRANGDVSIATYRTNITSTVALLGGGLSCVGRSSVIMATASFGVISATREAGFASLKRKCKVVLTDLNVDAVDPVRGDSEEILMSDSVYGSGGAKLVGGQDTHLHLERAYFGSSSTTNGVGGFMTVYNSATANVTRVDIGSSSALYGGVLYVSRDASLSVTGMTVGSGSSGIHGGCIYVGKGATLTTADVRLSNCTAGTRFGKFGSGGVVYVELGAAWPNPGSRNVTVTNSSAKIGQGVFLVQTDGSDGQTVTIPGLLDPKDVVAYAETNAQTGSIVITSPTQLLVGGSLAGITAQPGVPMDPFVLMTADNSGLEVSVPPTQTVSVVAYAVKVDANGIAVPSQYTVKLSGDTDKSFTLSQVTFSSLSIRAEPGFYRIKFRSGNLLYTDEHPLFKGEGVPLTVTSTCPSGKTISYEDSTNGPDCVVAAVPASSSSTLVTIIPATVVPGLVIAAIAVVAVRWQLLRYRAKKSKEAHNYFVSKHLNPRKEEFADLEIDRSLIQMQETLGEGEFGIVHKARLVLGGRPRICACKALKEGATYEQRIEFLAEAEIMKGLQNPHVVSLCGIVTVDEPMLILLEYVPHGSLRQFVRDLPDHARTDGITLLLLAHFARQIADGMAYLASMNIVHRDLAARNVMVGQDAFGEYLIKVADFGMSKQTLEDVYMKRNKKGKIPIKHCAPEALLHLRYSEKSDVWSYGVCIWEMYSFGGNPYPGIANVDVLSYISAGSRMARPESCPDEVHDVMMACWDSSPDMRPSFAEISTRLIEFIEVAEAGVDGGEPMGDGDGDGNVSIDVDVRASTDGTTPAIGAYVKPFAIGGADGVDGPGVDRDCYYGPNGSRDFLESAPRNSPYDNIPGDVEERYIRRPSDFDSIGPSPMKTFAAGLSAATQSEKRRESYQDAMKMMATCADPPSKPTANTAADKRRKSKDTAIEMSNLPSNPRRPSGPGVPSVGAVGKRRQTMDTGKTSTAGGTQSEQRRPTGAALSMSPRSPLSPREHRQNSTEFKDGSAEGVAAGSYLDLTDSKTHRDEAGPSNASGADGFYLVVNQVAAPSETGGSVGSTRSLNSIAANSPYVDVYSDHDN